METFMKTLEKLITQADSLSDSELAEKADAFLHIHTEEIQTDGKDTFHCHRYEPTPYRVLHALFDSLPLSETDTLLDYGSGLGRLNFYTNHRFKCGGIGVELASEFHREALHNLRQYRGVRRDRLQFINKRAEDYEIPDEVTMIYFFNPFSTDIFRSVMTNIEKSFERCQRNITLVLYYPEDNTVFYIERHTPFHLVREIPVPDFFEKDRRERFAVYRLSPSENFF